MEDELEDEHDPIVFDRVKVESFGHFPEVRMRQG